MFGLNEKVNNYCYCIGVRSQFQEVNEKEVKYLGVRRKCLGGE